LLQLFKRLNPGERWEYLFESLHLWLGSRSHFIVWHEYIVLSSIVRV
jgi:hypothetical protein